MLRIKPDSLGENSGPKKGKREKKRIHKVTNGEYHNTSIYPMTHITEIIYYYNILVYSIKEY
jgi:hypothetical protein